MFIGFEFEIICFLFRVSDFEFRVLYYKGSPSSSRPRTPAFHVGNTGSNPVGDANFFEVSVDFDERVSLGQGHPAFSRTTGVSLS